MAVRLRPAMGLLRAWRPAVTAAGRDGGVRACCCGGGGVAAALPADTNLLLMGAPGAGKSTVGRLVARRLGRPAVDVDDDVLEPAWGDTVGAKLAAWGGPRFLEEEAAALGNLSARGCVLSLSGSNPLHAAAMRHVKRRGLAVYLDVEHGDILRRLGAMKVERVVGLEEGRSVRDLLLYRKQFYERWMDVRVLCGPGEGAERVADKVLEAVARYYAGHAYVSTRAGADRPGVGFGEAALEGLAPDGGLYVPKDGFPALDGGEWRRLAAEPYARQARLLLERCVPPRQLSARRLGLMTERAYGSGFGQGPVAPVRRLAGGQLVLELFHGATASFKDLAMQLTPQLLAHCLPRHCNFLLLAATSGDTGGAALAGFGRLSGADAGRTGVLVFFPEDGVSQVQKLQMIGLGSGGGNARAVGVRSDFDFCQRSVKRMLGGEGLRGHLAAEYATILSTANSINWARLLPQVVYHASAYLSLCRDGVVAWGSPVDVCIPTGNFGNAMSALYAKEMGLPIGKVICASNHNGSLAHFLETGALELRGRRLTPSCSPAIDILKPSNLERLVHLASGGDGPLVRRLFSRPGGRLEAEALGRARRHLLAGSCSEDRCLDAIRRVHARTGYLMDPHTATAQAVAERLADGGRPVLIYATAHPDKFAPAVLRALRVPHVPEDAARQLKALHALSSEPGPHPGVMRCVAERGRRPHAVCGEDYGQLVEQVEGVIEDAFLKVA